MKKIKNTLLKLLLKLLLILVSFIAVTFVVYFFNLDMKLTAAMEPILFKFYDKVKRDQHL
ncbi:MAG: hypothetical protein Q4G31_03680 [bacterium]|nr:hypothetical protein [bacterium]MDY4635607.1 hypothetical protein [Candidatus Limivicinus sp.]